jgi:hypothetical protein
MVVSRDTLSRDGYTTTGGRDSAEPSGSPSPSPMLVILQITIIFSLMLTTHTKFYIIPITHNNLIIFFIYDVLGNNYT